MEQHFAAEQAETVDFLMRPSTYGGTAGAVERIDTHGAMIFLAGERAYKLKRAVKLPYLDFSTPDRRRAMCERELILNRRTAPQLYLEVAAIRRGPGGALTLGGTGEALDWVVVMQRFPETAVFDRLAADDRLDIALMAPLARVIRRFHGEAEVSVSAPWPATLSQIIDTLDETLRGPQAEPLKLAPAPYLKDLRGALLRRSPELAARQQSGQVRRCHGDLHLRNIVLLEGAPVLFDCIEFDEDLATIDVLYDLAFLLMDLWHRGRQAEANAVLNSYLEQETALDAWDGLQLLPFFLSLRAAIRAMVGVHGLTVAPEDRRGAAEEGVRAYTALARDLLQPRPPALIAVGGLSGTGKSTLARGLATIVGAAPGAVILRTDVERKLMLGAEPTTRLDRSVYAREVGNKVYARVLQKAAAILSAGHSVIVDAGFRRAGQREALASLVRRTGTAHHMLWLEASAQEMLARVDARSGDASDADRAVVLEQLRGHGGPPPGWAAIDAAGAPGDVLALARAACGASVSP